MKRFVSEGGEATNAKLTDEMIAEANALVDKEMKGRTEDKERVCSVWGKFFPNYFSIDCRTSFDYRDYKFIIQDDGSIEYVGMEGNFRN